MERSEMKGQEVEAGGGAEPIEAQDDLRSDDGPVETATSGDTEEVVAEVPRLRTFYERYEREASELDEEAVSDTRLPTKLPQLRRLVFDVVGDIEPDYLEGIDDLLKPERVRLIGTLGERIKSLSYALLYAWSQMEMHGEKLLASKELVRARMPEATELSRVGKHWLGVLEGLGYVRKHKADGIRAGKGYLDTALDLVRLAEVLDENWDALSLHQEAQWDEALRLDEGKIAHMGAVGSWLVYALSDDIEEQQRLETDWRRQVRALTHLLERSYFTLRDAAVYNLRAKGRFDDAKSLPTFRALLTAARFSSRRSGRKRKRSESPEEAVVDLAVGESHETGASSPAPEPPSEVFVEGVG